jgi:Tfp pilus assembly protein PilF
LFHKAVSYDPKFYRAYYHLGIIYFIKGKSENSVSYYRKAEEYLDKTLEIYPPYGRASLFLAKIYMELGEREKAKQYAKEALQKGLIPPLDKEAEHILMMGK